MSDTLNLFPSEGIAQASAIAAAGAPATEASGAPAITPPATPPAAAPPAVPPASTEASASPAPGPAATPPTPPASPTPPATPPAATPPATAQAAKDGQPPAPAIPPTGTPPNAAAPDATGSPEQPGQQTPEEIVAAAQRKMLEDLGVESLDDLKARLTPPPQLTPEQIKKQNDLHKANLQSYAVQKLGMTVEDFARADQLSQQDDESVVFSEFKKAWVAEHQADPAYKDKNLDEEARYVFEQYYHINNENEGLRQMGQRGLSMAAKYYKDAALTRITEATNSYNSFRQDQEDFQKFDGFLHKTLPELVPKSLSYEAVVNDKGERVKFDYALEASVLPEIMKALKTDFNFELYRTKGKEILPVLQAQVLNYLRINNHEKAVQAALSTGVSQGLQMGKVGPNAPFPISPAAPVQGVQNGELSQADIDKVAQVIGSGGF